HCARREDAQGVRTHRDGRTGGGRRPCAVSPGFGQSPGGRQIRHAMAAAIVFPVGAARAGAQEAAAPVPAPLELAHLEAPSGAPRTVTLHDALQRARENETQFQAVVADAASAREDRAQAKAGLLPVFSFTTQYLGNQANG